MKLTYDPDVDVIVQSHVKNGGFLQISFFIKNFTLRKHLGFSSI